MQTTVNSGRGSRFSAAILTALLAFMLTIGTAEQASAAMHWRPWQSGFKSISTCEARWKHLKSSGLATKYGLYDHQCRRDTKAPGYPWPPYKYALWVLEDNPYDPCGC